MKIKKDAELHVGKKYHLEVRRKKNEKREQLPWRLSQRRTEKR